MKDAHPVFLAFDYGTVRTGVAVGQSVTGTAMPLAPLGMKNNKADKTQLDSLIAEWQPTGFVLGMPALPDGDHCINIAKRVRSFAGYLNRHYSRSCYFVDERLSSRSLEDTCSEARLPGEPRVRAAADQAAADSRVAQALLCAWLQTAFPRDEEVSAKH